MAGILEHSSTPPPTLYFEFGLRSSIRLINQLNWANTAVVVTFTHIHVRYVELSSTAILPTYPSKVGTKYIGAHFPSTIRFLLIDNIFIQKKKVLIEKV